MGGKHEDQHSLFWVRVVRILERKQWKQKDLALRSGVPQNVISSGICRQANPSVRTAVRIADALGVSVEFLFSGHCPPGDEDLEESLELIRSSRKASEIARQLPYLSLKQYDALLAVILAFLENGLDDIPPE